MANEENTLTPPGESTASASADSESQTIRASTLDGRPAEAPAAAWDGRAAEIAAAAPGVPTTHPKGFWFIFSGELAERASFYGMKAVLTLYLVHVFLYTRDEASKLVHLYVAGCYFSSLLGGVIADRFLGKYWTIVLFAIPYIIGQFVVGLSVEYLTYGALVLLALGSGIIKPNISTLMGLTYDQQRPGQEQLRSQAFAWFYVAINIGSFLSTIICPWLRDTFGQVDPETGIPADPQRGYLAAFMFPAILMVVALGFFAAGKKYYAVEVIDRSPVSPEIRAARWKVVGQVFGLFFLVMFFWAIFDQHASTWIYFAEDYLDLNVAGFRIAPDSIQALNPLFIVLFVPLMNMLYVYLDRQGFKIRPTDKMIAGFILTAGCMGIHAVAGYAAVQPDGSIQKVSILWQVLAFVVITVAEILISVTGLELAFTAAPKAMKSFVTSLWLVTVGAANMFVATPVTQMYPGKPGTFRLFGIELFEVPKFANAGDYFLFLTVGMLVVAAVFFVVARRFNKARSSPTLDETRRDVAAAE